MFGCQLIEVESRDDKAEHTWASLHILSPSCTVTLEGGLSETPEPTESDSQSDQTWGSRGARAGSLTFRGSDSLNRFKWPCVLYRFSSRRSLTTRFCGCDDLSKVPVLLLLFVVVVVVSMVISAFVSREDVAS